MIISLIGAMGENRVIGADGKIPWHLPADFAHFKAVTMGHPVIMGRKTFESIGRPLPGRANIVISRDERYTVEGAYVVSSLEGAFALAQKSQGGDEVFILGGAQIYQLAMPHADRLYVTLVHGTFEGDAFFPEIDSNEWSLVSKEERKKDEKNAFDFDLLAYERKGATMNPQ